MGDLRSTASRRTVVASGIWASLQQFANIAFVGVFSIFLARTLSVRDFGIYGYATTLSAFGMAVGVGGLYALAVREYSNRPDEAPNITVAILLVREATAILAFLVLLAVAGRTLDDTDQLLAALLALCSILARVLDAPELWFQSIYKAGIIARIRVLVMSLFFGLKLVALLWQKDVLIVLTIYSAEFVVTSCLILFIYWRYRKPKPSFSRPRRREVWSLARQSFPLLISSVANQLNLRVGMIAVQVVVGIEAVGYFSAATRVTDVLFALPVAYMTATFPRMLGAYEAAKNGGAGAAEKLHEQIQRSFDLSMWAGLFVAFIAILVAPWAIPFAFGAEYTSSVELFQIQAFATPFVFLAAVFSKWIVMEGRLWLSVGRHVVGAVLNIALAFLLVSQIGPSGAAIASLIAIVVSSYVFCFFTSSTRTIAMAMTKTMTFPIRELRSRAAGERKK